MKNQMSRPARRHRAWLFLAVLGSGAVAQAADWANTSGGAWEDPVNWLNQILPTAADAANFNLAGTYDVTLASSPTVTSINVGGDLGLIVPSTRDLKMTNFAIDNATLRLSGGGFYSLGNLGNSSPTGAFSLDRGVLNVGGVGTEIRTNNDLELGKVAGNSVINLTNSGVIGVRRLMAAVAPGSTATINVSGNLNNTLFKGKNHVIGVAGSATLNVTNEGRFNAEPIGSSPAITVGYGDGVNAGTGWVNINGNTSLMNLKGEVRVADGPGSTGMFRITGGGRAAFSGTNSVPIAMTVGRNGGAGEVFVSGAGSNIKLNGQLAINQNLDTPAVRIETNAQIVASSVEYNGNSAASKHGLIIKGLGASLSTSGNVTLNSGDMLITDTGVLDAGGTVRLNATNDDIADIKFESGSLRAAAIEINGGNITLTRGANKVIRTGAISFLTPDAGIIDLADNALMVDYLDTQTSPIDQVRAAITPPPGPVSMARIVSSTANIDPDRFGLGIAEGGQLPDAGAGLRTFFREAADNTSVLVRYTYRGDATLDGTVNITDFANLAANFGESGRWFDGDFNDDGQVNVSDFALLASNFNETLRIDAGARTAVPEPALLGFVSALGLMAVRRRR